MFADGVAKFQRGSGRIRDPLARRRFRNGLASPVELAYCYLAVLTD